MGVKRKIGMEQRMDQDNSISFKVFSCFVPDVSDFGMFQTSAKVSTAWPAFAARSSPKILLEELCFYSEIAGGPPSRRYAMTARASGCFRND